MAFKQHVIVYNSPSRNDVQYTFYTVCMIQNTHIFLYLTTNMIIPAGQLAGIFLIISHHYFNNSINFSNNRLDISVSGTSNSIVGRGSLVLELPVL